MCALTSIRINCIETDVTYTDLNASDQGHIQKCNFAAEFAITHGIYIGRPETTKICSL